MSPRGGYCSSASTPHSSNGGGVSYSNANTANPNSQANGYSNMGAVPSSPASVFNSTSSKFIIIQVKTFVNIFKPTTGIENLKLRLYSYNLLNLFMAIRSLS